jgi:Protein NO VEIN, C-terminal
LECELIVADYLDMLAAECHGESYNKTEHREALKKKLPGRSDGSIEYKHQNITAALIQAGRIYIRGYKPAWNYQELLESVVLDRIAASEKLFTSAEEALILQSAGRAQVHDFASILVPPPERFEKPEIQDNRLRRPIKIDFAEREARNRALGNRGEEFVLELERRRLKEMGRNDLVGDVQWTSREVGDGVGYDIRSFSGETDKPLYIEVKTTNAGKYQPFMVSANELSFSEEYRDSFSLYRVFEFSRRAKVFMLSGAVGAHAALTATNYRATF